jgi:hypothetical protein
VLAKVGGMLRQATLRWSGASLCAHPPRRTASCAPPLSVVLSPRLFRCTCVFIVPFG